MGTRQRHQLDLLLSREGCFMDKYEAQPPPSPRITDIEFIISSSYLCGHQSSVFVKLFKSDYFLTGTVLDMDEELLGIKIQTFNSEIKVNTLFFPRMSIQALRNTDNLN